MSLKGTQANSLTLGKQGTDSPNEEKQILEQRECNERS